MILIDKPYASEFLKETIQNNGFQVVATPQAIEMLNDNSFNWISEEDAVDKIQNNPHEKIISPSENALDWLEKNLPNSQYAKQSKIFKDKIKFRELIKDIFPEFQFKEINLDDIQALDPKDFSYPFVIKPAIGFFSIGVYIIHNENDLIKAKKELLPEKLKSIYPESVLNTKKFIIESYISGDEFAIDYYHDSDGKVVILNILAHLFSSGSDTSDRVYITSKNIIILNKNEIEAFLTKIGDKLDLRNFPAHAEIRIDENGKIMPIEINPLRFGGWCTTGDILGIALNFNSYEHYFYGKKPNWDEVFRGKEVKVFSLIVLDNNSGIMPENIERFDYELLANDFDKTLLIRKIDYNEYSFFGFVFAETKEETRHELYNILHSDLRKYIIKKSIDK